MNGGGVEYTAATGLNFFVWRGACLCHGGSWTKLSIGLHDHGKRAPTPAYLQLTGMVVSRGKDMAALVTILANNIQESGHFVVK